MISLFSRTECLKRSKLCEWLTSKGVRKLSTRVGGSGKLEKHLSVTVDWTIEGSCVEIGVVEGFEGRECLSGLKFL